MGIINATPDSFYDGGKNIDLDKAVLKVEEMLKKKCAGARGRGGKEQNIIDIGGYSTKPNASEISIEEEEGRVIPIIKTLIQKFPDIVISIDTFRSKIAGKGSGGCCVYHK